MLVYPAAELGWSGDCTARSISGLTGLLGRWVFGSFESYGAFILSEPKLDKWAFGFYSMFLSPHVTVFQKSLFNTVIWLS